MTEPVHFRPTNPNARRAALALFVTAGLATLFGVLALVAANVSLAHTDPALREQFDLIRSRTGVEPRLVYNLIGGVVLAYAVAAAATGWAVRGGHPTACVVGGVLTGLASLGSGVLAVVALTGGDVAGAAVPTAFAVVHGLCTRWLAAAVAAATTTIVRPRRPLEAYYLPPVDPTSAA